MHEALTYSAFLRLPEAVSRQVKEDFVEEIMNVVELGPLRNAIVGLPGEEQLVHGSLLGRDLSCACRVQGNCIAIACTEPHCKLLSHVLTTL